jgi:hypothetical protein
MEKETTKQKKPVGRKIQSIRINGEKNNQTEDLIGRVNK